MKNKKALFIPLVLAAAFFFTTCGLDTTYYINMTGTAVHEPVYTSSDFASNYFEFTSATKPSEFDSDFKFLGTAVYYRIYADSSTMMSRQSAISAVNTATDYTAAATKMIGYGYQQLNTSDGNVQPLITAEGVKVRIRLTNYGAENDSSNEYRAQITYLNKIPRRSIGQTKTFDFGRHGNNKYTPQENYDLPAAGDEDFENGTVKDNKYYVDLYAVALGRDTTFTLYYSQVLHLGSIPIDATAENN